MDLETQRFLYDNCYLKMTLKDTAHKFLQKFINIDVSSSSLAEILKRNQAYEHFLIRFIDIKTGGKLPGKAAMEAAAEASPEAAPATTKPKDGEQAQQPNKEADKEDEFKTPLSYLIVLLGMLTTRNFILTLRLYHSTKEAIPVDEQGNFTIEPNESLKYALQAEEFCSKNKIAHPEVAFAAALLFDWLAVIIKKTSKDQKAVQAYVDDAWKSALKLARISYALAGKIPNFGYKKNSFAAGIIIGAGKAIMALTFSKDRKETSWAEFEEEWKEVKELSMLAQLLDERSVFQTTHEELAALILDFFTIFKRLIPVIRYYREPYFLKKAKRDQFRLAGILYVSSMMLKDWTRPDGPNHPLVVKWKAALPQGLKFTADHFVMAMKEAMATNY